MSRSLRIVLILCLLLIFSGISYAIEPLAVDLANRENWVRTKFEPKSEPDKETGKSKIGIEVIENHNAVQRNSSHEGVPIRIGEKVYPHGLYTHAPSRLIVRLSAPGKKFSAVIGVDNNHSTSGSRGSVRFHLIRDGKSLFESPIMRGGEAGRLVEIDLEGATEFEMLVDDGGDHISCDQAEWASPEVLLENGTVLKLEEMPIHDPRYVTELTDDPPFSFEYNGKKSGEFLKNWKKEFSKKKLENGKIERIVKYTDPTDTLEVRCVSIEYVNYPSIEWILYFKNIGKEDTPIIRNIRSVDTIIPRKSSGACTLNYSIGSPCIPEDFKPLQARLNPGEERTIATSGGRPSDAHMPYFNIESGGEGVIAVIGWPGQWNSGFRNVSNAGVHISAGQELTNFKLFPGEEVRSPITVLQFWTGNREDSQNIWRAWMIEHNLPRIDGKVENLLTSHGCSSGYFYEMVHADAASQMMFIDGYVREKIDIDFWWMDAGWYPCGDWPQTGTWELDKKRFPNGFREIYEHGKKNDIGIIVWFEPERVRAGTWFAENHPEWLLKGEPDSLLDLGNPEALAWLINHIDAMIKREGIGYYRQDFNMAPLDYWRRNDAPDRQGITEIRHVCGYLAYWDALLERNPGLRFDTCASGGRRDDLETLRRAVPLHRSDYRSNISNQGQSYGLAPWIPVFGLGSHGDLYTMRSGLTPCITLGPDMRNENENFEICRDQMSLWNRSKKYWFGDYYPLSGYSLDPEAWMAWQYHLPKIEEGMIQIFRRENSDYIASRYKLRGLSSEKTYEIEDMDTGIIGEYSGRELLENGLKIEIEKRPNGKVLFYRSKK